VQKALFRFVKQAISIARKLTDAALTQVSHPAGNGVAGWKHAVPHFLRHHMDATLEEALDWAEEMERVRAALVLERGEFPGPSALCKSFDRAPMWIWRELLRLGALDQ
jgi:IS5 family transposase